MDGLLLPALILAFIGWLVPKLWARVLSEGVKPLLVNALLSTLTMGIAGILYFVILYLIHGTPLNQITGVGFGPSIVYFGRLALISALLWGPIMILSLAGVPRRWKKAVW